jgi:glycogen debranching enzyme
MNNVNRLRPMPSHLITYEGEAIVITDLAGFIGSGVEGFYYRHTRFLSKMRFTVGGEPPRAVSANPVDSHSLIAYYLAASPAGGKAGPQPDKAESASEMVQHGIEIQINRFVGGGLHHDVYVTNHALAPATIVLCWEIDADFADRSEAENGERQQNAPIERQWRLCEGDGDLAFRYRHPQLRHATEIRFSGSDGLLEKDGAVCCILNLAPQQPVSLGVDVIPVFCEKPVTLRHGRDAFAAVPGEATSDGGLRMTACSEPVQRAWDRAVSDLASLAMLEGEGVARRTPAAGVPKYLALFGRDVLNTAFQAGFLAPEMMRGSLLRIAEWNADKYDDRYDEQPGRVLHQRQLGPLALLEKNPFLHYYGDYSAPGLFLIDLAWDLALTGDKEFFLSMRDKALHTLEWMDRDGDSDGDGFYEHATKAGSWGEKNQGWKDSGDAILYEDGHMVENPIAVCEVQGCYYAAKQLMGLAFASVGEERRAAELLAQAERLKRRFNDTFWMPEHQYFALALDPDKKLVRTIASDSGQCLFYGIVDDDKAQAVAARLMMPELFSGWGVRTLSTRHPAFNPFAYHLGSVWPASNGMIGFGLKRYGFDSQLHQLAKGIFDASQIFYLDRLPEVMGGHARDRRHPHPGIYPDACSPQAWSAGAVILLVHSMLGLIPVAPRRTLIIDPDLPEWLPELTLSNIRIGNARVSLRFWRDAAGYTQDEVVAQQGELRIHRTLARDKGVDRFARCVEEVASR